MTIIKELSKTHKCNYYIQANKPLAPNARHYKRFGDYVFLTDTNVDMLIPLLMNQPYIQKVDKYTNQEIDIRSVIPAFIISELKTAFQIGFLIYIPFLILDMVVASILLSMGMMMLPPILISLPFKLVFFVLVDGWHLVTNSLVLSFG